MDLVRGQSLVLTVVDLVQQGCQLRLLEARELGGPQRALQRAGESGVEADDAELESERFRLLLSPYGQRKVGLAGVAT